MAIGAVLLVGCGSQISQRRVAPTQKGADGAYPAQGDKHVRSRPYLLYTHCGIEWAKIKGTFWRATPGLSDGDGNPPPGWGNPFQAGTLTVLSRTRARFRSSAGSVTFERTTRAGPPFICA